jgi:hypothetical protein
LLLNIYDTTLIEENVKINKVEKDPPYKTPLSNPDGTVD